MQRRAALCLAVVVLLAASGHAGEEGVGRLQITCWPGHRVYVDGQLQGLSKAEEDGLFLDGVAAGAHEVRVEKLGFVPFIAQVDVPAGGLVELKVGQLEATTDAGPSVEAGGQGPAEDATETPDPQPETTASEPAEEPREVSDDQPGFVITRASERERDVAFAYRARGQALSSASTVAVYREHGGPRSPVLVFLCDKGPECVGQTKASFESGSYRFRVTFRNAGDRAKAPAGFRHDRFLDLEAQGGKSYLIDVRFDGPAIERCWAEVSELE